jgi:hypothetical protein
MKVCAAPGCNKKIDFTKRSNAALTCGDECQRVYHLDYVRRRRREFRASPEGKAKIKAQREASREKTRKYNRLYARKRRSANRKQNNSKENKNDE